MLERLQALLDDQTHEHGIEVARAAIGVILLDSILEELKANGHAVRRGAPDKTEEEIVVTAIANACQNWPLQSQQAEKLLDRVSAQKIDDRLKSAFAEFMQAERKRFSNGFIYAMLVNIAANFAWVGISFLVLAFAVLVMNGWSFETLVSSLQQMGKAHNG